MPCDRSICVAMLFPLACAAALATMLAKPIVDPQQTLEEVQTFTQARIIPMPDPHSVSEWERHADWIRAKIEAQPDMYLWERQAAAQAELGWTTCDMTFVGACRALRLTRKKRRRSPPSASVRR